MHLRPDQPPVVPQAEQEAPPRRYAVQQGVRGQLAHAERQVLGPAWFKSAYSGSEGGQCLEVAVSPGAVRIRDSKETPSPDRALCVSAVTWVAFTSALK